MRGDLPAAAFRLSSTLPARTHAWSPPAPKQSLTREQRADYDRSRRAKHPGSGRGGRNGRAITVGKRVFDNLAHAMRELRIGKTTMYRMLDLGEARRAEK